MEAKEVLEYFLSAWKKQDYKSMHELCTDTYKVANSKAQLSGLLPVKATSGKVGLVEFSDCVSDVQLTVRLKGAKKSVKVLARLIKEKAPFKPSNEGRWGVNPISILKGLNG